MTIKTQLKTHITPVSTPSERTGCYAYRQRVNLKEPWRLLSDSRYVSTRKRAPEESNLVHRQERGHTIPALMTVKDYEKLSCIIREVEKETFLTEPIKSKK